MRNGAPRRKGPTSMTDGRKRAFGVEGADVGLGLRPKNIGARVKRVEHHGFAFPQRWCYDKPAAERHWERLIALYRRRLG